MVLARHRLAPPPRQKCELAASFETCDLDRAWGRRVAVRAEDNRRRRAPRPARRRVGIRCRRTDTEPKLASHSRVAFASIALNTDSSSPGELEMTLRTSEVAACCSSASSRSRVRWSSCFCRSAALGLRRRAAVGALLRLGFVVLPCCAFAGLRLIVRRRLTLPSHGPTIIRYHIIRAVVQHSKIECRVSAWGLGRVKTKSDLVVMTSGRQIFAFFCSPQDHRAQNFRCGYTA